jgi:Asp/Glu/hydantoin racemase
MMMDRRTLLQVGVPAAVAASMGVSSAADAAVPTGTGARPIRILFLDHAPRKQSADRLYDPTPIERLLNSYANPGTKIEIGYPDNYDGSKVGLLLGEQDKLNGLDHLMAAPALIRKIFWAQQNGYDAVIQSNTFDPGVEGGRLAVGIPVIGPFRTAMHTALMLCDRIGVTTPLASDVPQTRRILRAYGLESFVADIKPVGVYGKDIQRRKNELFDAAAKAMRSLVNDSGAQIIVPLGGALIPYVVDPNDLAKAAGVPVLNTKAIAIRFAEACVAFGMTQSPVAYPHAALEMQDFQDRL